MKTTADESEDAFSGMTEPLEVEGSDTVRDEVIAYSQEQYGTPKKTVEAYMEELFTTDKQPKKPKAAATTTKKSGSLKTKDTAKVHGA
jgi:hypothetical protein